MPNDWKRVNASYFQNGNWTITESPNVPKPYCLFKGPSSDVIFYGCFKTFDDAVKMYEELNA